MTGNAAPGARAGVRSATAFAPASVGNACVGFDVLGFSFDVVGDRVRVEISEKPGVEIVDVTGVGGGDFPRDPLRNTAGVPLLEIIKHLHLPHGFRIWIEKGIPVGSGMGGSAASAVGAVVAANALLPLRPDGKPALDRAQLLDFALSGEAVASGSRHADNVAPCLWGGLVLSPTESGGIVAIPLPAGLHCVLVHPHVVVETRAARALLKPTLGLKDYVRQSGYLAGFLAACFRSDLRLLRECFRDILIEPQRSVLIPGFAGAKDAALSAGALGFAIAGSGPSVFAWAEDAATAQRVRRAVDDVFARIGVGRDSWTASLEAPGARVLDA